MKILIWDVSFILSKAGGPAGYLYNIKEYLREHSNSVISFYSDRLPLIKNRRHEESVNRWQALHKLSFMRIIIDVRWLLLQYYNTVRCEFSYDDLGTYDFIHIHHILDIVKYVTIQPKYQ